MSAVSPSISAFPFRDHTESGRHNIQRVAMFNPLDFRSPRYGDPGSNANKSNTKNWDSYAKAAPCCSGPAANGKSGTDRSLHYTIPSSAKVPSSVTASGNCHLGAVEHSQNDSTRYCSYKQSSHHANTNGGQSLSGNCRADAQLSGNEPLGIPSFEASSGISKTSSVIVLPDSDHDMVERLCASINELRDKIANKWDHYDKLHRHLPVYDVGPVSRPQLFPNTTHTSIFKGRSSPPDIPKPAAPRPPLKVLPLHGLSGTGIISVYDCQHMYRAGRVGKHDDLQKIYFDVDNAPKYQSHMIDWGNLRPLLQAPPKDYQDLVDGHHAMLGMNHKLSPAEPGIAVSAPKGKWDKETIGLTSQEDLAQIRKDRAQSNTASYIKACVAALEAVGVTGFREELIGIASPQPGTNEHDAGIGDFQGYTNGGHRSVNGGYQPFTLTLPAINALDGDDIPEPNGNPTEHRPRMKELHRATTGDHQGALNKYHAECAGISKLPPRGNSAIARVNNAKVDGA